MTQPIHLLHRNDTASFSFRQPLFYHAHCTEKQIVVVPPLRKSEHETLSISPNAHSRERHLAKRQDGGHNAIAHHVSTTLQPVTHGVKHAQPATKNILGVLCQPSERSVTACTHLTLFPPSSLSRPQEKIEKIRKSGGTGLASISFLDRSVPDLIDGFPIKPNSPLGSAPGQ